ncbi:MAG: restriction endonuclease subunit S [Clostridiaceae bacterium]|nr:restriction endonuclease subunit S [Clostridiaceae bacterium]
MSKWEMVKLGDVCDINMGQSPGSESYNEENDGIPFYQGNADFGQIHPNVRYYCNKPTKIANKDDVLLSVRAPIGALNIATEKCCIGRGLCAITQKENTSHYKYLYYILKFKNSELNARGTGSTFKAINKTNLLSIKIPLPPLDIQKHIANTLDKTQEIINGHKKQLEELDHLIKATFYDMFGDPVTNEKGWNECKLGDVCTIVRGGSPRPIQKFLGGTIPWIKIGDATKGDDLYLTSTKEHIIEEGVKKSRFIKSESMIFANCGVSLGFARIITFDGCIHDGWLAFDITSNDLNNIFLLKQINEKTEYFRRTAPSGTQPNLNTTIMKNTSIIVPPVYLQNKFTQIVNNIEQQKSLVKQSITESETLFNSLMSKYFD